MNRLEIKYINVNNIVPYENNPRKNEEAISFVMESIKKFGFKNPIILDKNNVVVCGHTRLESAKRLELEEVPCLYADDLTEEEITAFRLADNKVSETAKWDLDKLEEEILKIDTIDMDDFGFDLDFDIKDIIKDNERHRTNDTYNLDLVDIENSSNDFWQMPIIENDNFIPSDLIGFNYAKTSKTKNAGIHFYLDDYQFERVWNNPEKYTDILSEYECILSPDFSLYVDMPMPMKIWNVYRSRQIGHYYQALGLKVIPTISWAEKETFEFAFKGIPKGSIVSVSTIGVKTNETAFNIWEDGMDAMIKEIEPRTILVYGGEVEYNYGGIEVIYFKNKVTERVGKSGKNET